MKWKPYALTLIGCSLAELIAFKMHYVSIVILAVIPASWAIYRLVVSMASRRVPAEPKPYITTLVACGLVLMLTGPPHAGFMICFVGFFLAMWIVLGMIAVIQEREELKPRAIKLGLWMATIAIVLGLHWHYAVDARQTADNYARAIEQYKSEHGAYPRDLMAAGLDEKAAHRLMLSYSVDDGKPFLIYAATFIIFDTYDYDFEHHTWKYSD